MNLSRKFLVSIYAALVAAAAPAHAAQNSCVHDPLKEPRRQILWTIVRNECLRQQHSPTHDIRCENGYAILKDIAGATQYLLIPTVPTSGIEDDHLRAPQTPNYWQAAWAERRAVVEKASSAHAFPPGADPAHPDISLAVNSTCTRTQDQLHIHMDFLDPPVRKLIAAEIAAQGPSFAQSWQTLNTKLRNDTYMVRHVDSLSGGNEPFHLLTALPGHPPSAAESLAVIAADTGNATAGFYILAMNKNSSNSNSGAAELLQICHQNCAYRQ